MEMLISLEGLPQETHETSFPQDEWVKKISMYEPFPYFPVVSDSDSEAQILSVLMGPSHKLA